MSSGLAPWRALARLAWRDTVRHKGRTTLVIALIGIPVALMLIASVAIRTTVLTREQQRRLQLGAVADLSVSASTKVQGDTLIPAPTGLPSLPASSRSVELLRGSNVRFWAKGYPDRPLAVGTVSGDFNDPILAGAHLLRSGQWPTTVDDVAITTDIAKRAHLRVGQTIDLLVPKRTVTVVGTYDNRGQLDNAEFATTSPLLVAPSFQQREIWVDLGLNVTELETKAVAERLWQQGWRTQSLDLFPGGFDTGGGSSASGRSTSEGTPIAVMNVAGIITLFLLGTIVTAAFAVGARRQLRILGVIGANGGDPRQLRRLVTLQGTAAAFVGAIVGFVLGTIGLVALAPYANRITRHVLPGIEISPFDVVLAFVLALLAGSIAAGLPGRTAARVPVLNALGGRRPLRELSNSLPLVGIVISGIGVALLVSSTRPNSIVGSWLPAAVGGVLVLLGGVIVAPWLVGKLAPLATVAHGAARLAIRRTTRHRGRSGPIVAAILATGAVTIAANTLIESVDRGTRQRYLPYLAQNEVDLTAFSTRDGLPADPQQMTDAIRAVTKVLPDATVIPHGRVGFVHGGASAWYQMAVAGVTSGPDLAGANGGFTLIKNGSPAALQILTGTPDLLRAIHVPDRLIEAFNQGKALASGPFASARMNIIQYTQAAPETQAAADQVRPVERSITIPAEVTSTLDIGYKFAGSNCNGGVCSPLRYTTLILPPSVAEANSIDIVPAATIFAKAALTASQIDQLAGVYQDLIDSADERAGYVEHDQSVASVEFEHYRFRPARLVELIVTGLALLLTLAVTAVSLALATVDNRSDDATLASLGASPSIRRRLRAWEAWLLATAGMALAIPFGFIPGAAVTMAQGAHDPIVFPWRTVAMLVIVVPLVAAGIGWLSTRSPRRITPNLADV